MYIEEFDGLPHGDWLRACVSLPISHAARAEAGVIETIFRRARTVPNLAVAVRVRFQPARVLTRTYFFLAPTSAEGPLRKLVAGFSRLELSTGPAATLPKTPEDADRILGAFGRWRSRLVVEAQGTGEPWYLPEFAVYAQLDELLCLADAASESLTYQCNFWPYTLSDHSLRQCARNVLKIENTNGVPRELLDLQRRIRARLASAEFLVEEYLGVDSLDLASELSAQLQGCFSRRHDHLRFPRLTFPFYETAYSDEIESGFHRCAIAGSAPPEEWVEACSFDRLAPEKTARLLCVYCSRRARRYWIASATCAWPMVSAPARSATVRATLSTRW